VTSVPIIALDRTPLRDQAVEVLRTMVISGDLAQGARLNEAELAGKLGISRGPLREAIQRLGAEGFIVFQRNRGAFVRTLTPDDLRQMYVARQAIEASAARLAAGRATNEGVAQLQELLAAVDTVLRTDTSGAYPVGFDLHKLVLDLCENTYLQRIGEDLANQVRLARIRSGSSPERARAALTEHQEIIAAIADRDPQRAGDLMHTHIEGSLRNLLAGLGDH
jgi:DNA-binding GntR family transcriptional regulator